MKDKLFNFILWDKTFHFLPIFDLNVELEYISIGWLVFRIEIHYDRWGKK